MVGGAVRPARGPVGVVVSWDEQPSPSRVLPLMQPSSWSLGLSARPRRISTTESAAPSGDVPAS